ncbi:transmembrane protein 263-like [Lineus longissimus]|uniref:transmembrane protein 263-like n=1 Tax=Lineus longissimus TaxID=88925 RepID=UPI002B4E3231
MSNLYQSVVSCLQRGSKPGEPAMPDNEMKTENGDPSEVKENEAPEYSSDKKTDEVLEPQPQSGYLWRMGSGVFNVTTGAVGLGVGGVKWVAGKSYDVGSAVYSKAPAIPKISLKRKDKKE